jgi:hypothetical protein
MLSLSGGETRSIHRRIAYRTVENLIGEYARCVTNGGCVIKAPRPIELGSNFVFEMCSEHPGSCGELEIEGKVVAVRAVDQDFEIGIEYRTRSPRDVIEAVVAQIGVDRSFAVVRSHPRIPVNLLARDRDSSELLAIRDLSRGGLQLEGDSLPGRAIGAGLAVEIVLGAARFAIRGRVAWCRDNQVGVTFDPLGDVELMVIDGMLRLLQPSQVIITFDDPPTHAQPEVIASFGDAAVDYLRRLPGNLAILPDSPELPALQDTMRARVAITGDLEGELVIEAELGLCATLARAVLGDAVQADDELDFALIADALTELATMIAGWACDAVEDACVASVSTPLASVAPRHAEAVDRSYMFGDCSGLARLTIVAQPAS